MMHSSSLVPPSRRLDLQSRFNQDVRTPTFTLSGGVRPGFDACRIFIAEFRGTKRRVDKPGNLAPVRAVYLEPRIEPIRLATTGPTVHVQNRAKRVHSCP